MGVLLNIPTSNNLIGVYQIRNISNNKCYIGSSMDLRARAKSHASAIKNNNHNIKDIAKDSANNNIFNFEILETVNADEKTDRVFQEIRIKEYTRIKERLENNETLYNKEDLERVNICLKNAQDRLNGRQCGWWSNDTKFMYRKSKDNYIHFTVTIPRGLKEEVKKEGFTLNGYINRLIKLDRQKKKREEKKKQEKLNK